MPLPESNLCFRPREFKGSRKRCLLLTSQSREMVRSFLHRMIAPYGELNEDARWLPGGFLDPREANLDRKVSPEFLSDDQRACLASWWLKNRQGATTPTWDIAAACEVSGKSGLVLVEAKAHAGELSRDDTCKSGNAENREQIAQAILEANRGLNSVLPGWALQCDKHYQLSNRFALSWKLASMGVPVILVYLGFLDAWDMNDVARTILISPEQWRDCMYEYTKDIVPRSAWESQILDTPLVPLIRAARVEISAEFCRISS